MEDTLRAQLIEGKIYAYECLNPCFNGRYSQRVHLIRLLCNKTVLILVLMEDTLRAFKKSIKNFIGKGLNPCFNGRYSQSYEVYY